MYDVLGCCAVAYQGYYLRVGQIGSFRLGTFNFHVAKC